MGKLKKSSHPERSRGIPVRWLEGFTTGSLDCARDDAAARMDSSLGQVSPPALAQAEDGPVSSPKKKASVADSNSHRCSTINPAKQATPAPHQCG
jgi:hypothetical protein